MGTNSQKDFKKPKELYTGNKEQKRHVWWNDHEYLVNERPKDFLKGKKGQNDLYIRIGTNSQKTYTCRMKVKKTCIYAC